MPAVKRLSASTLAKCLREAHDVLPWPDGMVAGARRLPVLLCLERDRVRCRVVWPARREMLQVSKKVSL